MYIFMKETQHIQDSELATVSSIPKLCWNIFFEDKGGLLYELQQKTPCL